MGSETPSVIECVLELSESGRCPDVFCARMSSSLTVCLRLLSDRDTVASVGFLQPKLTFCDRAVARATTIKVFRHALALDEVMMSDA